MYIYATCLYIQMQNNYSSHLRKKNNVKKIRVINLIKLSWDPQHCL